MNVVVKDFSKSSVHNIRHTTPTSADTPKDFYLKRNDDGIIKLSPTHKYYYQVRGQMGVCERKYTYFVCWTPHGLHLEQIQYDTRFFSSIKPRLDDFFLDVILPAVPRGECADGDSESMSKKQKSYCYCQREEEYDDMIECENPSCTFVWFHFSCVGIVTPPNYNYLPWIKNNNYDNLLITILRQCYDTTEAQIFVSAEHTTSSLSILAKSVSSLCFDPTVVCNSSLY